MVGTSRDSVHPDLLIGHAVDDAVVAGVHVPHDVGGGDDGQRQGDHQPQHDVEDHGVVDVVLVGQVERAVRVTLEPDRVGEDTQKMFQKNREPFFFFLQDTCNQKYIYIFKKKYVHILHGHDRTNITNVIKLTICLDSKMERDFLVKGASKLFTVTTSTTALLP